MGVATLGVSDRFAGLIRTVQNLINRDERTSQQTEALRKAMECFTDGKPFRVLTAEDGFTPFSPVPEYVRRRMAELHESIFGRSPEYNSANGSGTTLEEKRSLTLDEFGWIFNLVREYKLPIEVRSVNFGHEFGVFVYDHDYDPQDPPPHLRLLLAFLHTQVPVEQCSSPYNRMSQAYAMVLKQLNLNENYDRILAFYGLKPLPQTSAPFHS